MSDLILHTKRLELIPTTLEHLEAELQEPCALGSLIGATIPSGWPPGEYDRDALEYFHSKLMAGGPSHVGWYGWYGITLKIDGSRDELVVGAGYFGPPSEGVVEIGYSVVPSARRKGFASEMVAALVDHAFKQNSVQAVIAHTTDSNHASCMVLTHCGFHRVGPGSQPDSVQFRRQKP
jgi:RimJ/RimL family protein N-acetyltransferase